MMRLDLRAAWAAPLIRADIFESSTDIDLLELETVIGKIETLELGGHVFVRPRQIARLISDAFDRGEPTCEVM